MGATRGADRTFHTAGHVCVGEINCTRPVVLANARPHNHKQRLFAEAPTRVVCERKRSHGCSFPLPPSRVVTFARRPLAGIAAYLPSDKQNLFAGRLDGIFERTQVRQISCNLPRLVQTSFRCHTRLQGWNTQSERRCEGDPSWRSHAGNKVSPEHHHRCASFGVACAE